MTQSLIDTLNFLTAKVAEFFRKGHRENKNSLRTLRELSCALRLAFFLLLFYPCLYAQKTKTIELLHANSLEFDNHLGNNAKRLIGNVSFKDGAAIMNCDSAYLYDNNSADAFGNIRITQGDSISVTGKTLKYNGNTKMAELHDNVQMNDRDMVLTSTVLFYDVKAGVANYTGGGKIVSKENVLSSENGYYFTNAKEMHFKKNVVLVNPQYTMNCDTLNYNTLSKIAYFLGPTRIKSSDQSDVIYCENGWYNTVTDIAQFNKNSYIITKEHTLKADSLYYDRKSGIGKGFKNVEINDTIEKIIVTGDYAYNNEKTFLSIVTGHAVMKQVDENDTLFIHADTLKSLVDSHKSLVKGKDKLTQDSRLNTQDSLNKNRTIYAYNKVKFFKKDMQGKCDSLVYSYSDSTMHLFTEPILWSEQNQLTAEKIDIKTNKGELNSIQLTNSSFIISENDTTRYNQIKGKDMHGTFLHNKLYKIKVEGNGQTVYYVKEKANGSDKEKLIGVNRAECTDLLIFLKNNEVDKVTFITKPDATMYPINELDPKELILKDFLWKINQRPKTKNDIF